MDKVASEFFSVTSRSTVKRRAESSTRPFENYRKLPFPRRVTKRRIILNVPRFVLSARRIYGEKNYTTRETLRRPDNLFRVTFDCAQTATKV